MNTPTRVPDVTFKTHSHDKKVCDDYPFKWIDVTTDEVFKGKKIVLFALPGAFTPTCSSQHLPGYEEKFEEFKELGIDEVICLSVNDAFVMNRWGIDQDVKNVRLLPDGSTHFTKGMDMLVRKDDLGFGERSWRYSMFVDNGEIKKVFTEEGKCNDCVTDPFEVSGADTMLGYLKEE